MSPLSAQEITELLQSWGAGDQDALAKLIPIVYSELHQLAHRYMLHERESVTLQTTALVNELYLRLVDIRGIGWKDRSHFLAVCAQVMRRILVDFARSRQSLKRGGQTLQVPFEEHAAASEEPGVDVLDLDEALTQLAAFDPRKGRVVELRFFGGLAIEEIAGLLAVSPDTVKRDWKLARVWLLRELSREDGHGA